MEKIKKREQYLNETGDDKNGQETDSRDSQEVKSRELRTKLDMKEWVNHVSWCLADKMDT